MMTITLNGESTEVPDGATVADLLVQLVLSPDRLAVIVNSAVIRKCSHGEKVLAPGDQVDFITMVGGG